MESLTQRQVFVLGTGPVAQSSAAAFADLGFDAYVGTLDEELPQWARPEITVVCDGQVATTQQLEKLVAETGTYLVPSLDACSITRTREGIRRTAAEELGLPTMAYEFANSVGELAGCAEAVGYPCVVKPSISAGGCGHTVVHGPDDLDAAWQRARETNPEGAVAVERYVDFDYEVTIITARSVDPETGQLATWFCEPIGTRHETGRLVEAWQPAPLSEAAMDNARSIAARITGRIGAQGVYSIELFVDGDEVYFSDVNPRPSPDGMVTLATQRIDQFDLHARAVAGLPIDVTLMTPGAACYVAGKAHSGEALVRALTVEETTIHVLEETTVVRSTAEDVQQARVQAERAAHFLS
ncbi:ATP-grasp domain-containing protein [Corynebacterium sanguinis]|uniref:ATP-grasp domain-containing protein n=1 Tax=Corynebacterium sanguinis TaxID=2594913 RepID=UPI00119CC969|nr:ATP-grasp domain-containing protein [Corynebacterium sanguinis]MCT1585448.1 ATP-grasp domain-containing protein [Corynebacterium sanguinis]